MPTDNANMETVTNIRSTTQHKVWTQVNTPNGKAFMAFRSGLKGHSCPNCSSNLSLRDLKDIITQPVADGLSVGVGWNIECSNCQARLEILNDKE